MSPAVFIGALDNVLFDILVHYVEFCRKGNLYPCITNISFPFHLTRPDSFYVSYMIT